MGEAKRRERSEPHFGLKPKMGRGIFLSAPVEALPNKLTLKSSSIDAAELRRAVLFWDRLVWPDSNIISLGSNQDEQLLEDEGILKRPRPNNFNGVAGSNAMSSFIKITDSTDISLDGEQWAIFAKQHVEEYLRFDSREPGLWAMAEGAKSLIMKADNFVQGRGQLISLVRAIPLPDANFPLHDLLEFKAKRSDEIVAVNYELDKFYSQIAKTNDPSFELARLVSVVDRQCADLIKASRESKRHFHLGDISISLSVDNAESMINRAIAWEAAFAVGVGLPLIGGALGATVSLLSISRGLGARRKSNRSSPFRVAATMHNELIR